MRRLPFDKILLLLFLSTQARTEDTSLGEIQVRGSREEGSAAGATEARYDSAAFTTVITAEEWKGRKTTVTEILQDLSGVAVKQRGGADDFATVSIRGSTSEQVAVYVDGILQNQGMGGAPNLAAIPMDQIERIEIYKGAAPARFGSSSIGGVVNIVTKKAEGGRSTVVTQSYGSFKTYEGSLVHSQTVAPFSYNAATTSARSAGDVTFSDDNGTPFNPDDDRTIARANNEFARHNLSAGMRWKSENIDGLEIAFQDQFFREDRGIPGLATLTSQIADLSTTRNGASLEVTKRRLWRDLDASLVPFFQYQKQQFSDPAGDIGLGIQDNDNDTFQYGARLEGQKLLGRHQRLGAYLEYRGEQFLPEDFAQTPSSTPRSVRNSASLSLEDEVVFFDERLVLNPSVRTEHLFDDQAGVSSDHHPVSGKIGIKYQPTGREGVLTFKTNFSRSFRIPSFSELYGDRGTFVGNPALRPETGWNWDIGAIVTKKPVRFEVSFYLNHVNDLIQFVQTSQFTVQAQNLNSARIQGVETNLAATFFEHLDLSANYTFQWAKDTSGLPGLNGNFLPGRPLHEISGKMALYNDWGRLFADATFIDDNFLDTANVLKANNRFLLGVGASLSFLKRFTTTVEGKNLLNDRVSDIVGFPLPGRSVTAKLEVKI